MSTEVNQREVLTAYLERERALWLPARDRAQRASGMSADANAEEAKHMRQLDALLDELGGLALSNSCEISGTSAGEAKNDG